MAEAGVPFQIGSCHRYELGRAEMFRSQSFDPELPTEACVAVSGGIYLNSATHDTDTARFVMGEVEQVSALGRALIAPFLERDIDTSILTLEFASGAIGAIQSSRRASYGHDIRLEVLCEGGKVVSEEERATRVWCYSKQGIGGDYIQNFQERFRPAYLAELQAFTAAVQGGVDPSPVPTDAVESLRIALAARRSLMEGRSVAVAEVR